MAGLGRGKVGYCKICAFEHVRRLDKRLKDGASAPEIVAWLKDTYDFSVDRKTVLSHKHHITDPRKTLVERAQANPVIPYTGSSADVLDAVIGIGYQKVIDNPDSVGVNQLLKALQIKEGSKQKTTPILVLMQRALLRSSVSEPLTIEGEAREVIR